jgi:hypothetical protein
MYLFNSGNLALQNAGTFVDNGSRLQVNASGSQTALFVSGSSSFSGSVNISSSLTVNGSSVVLSNQTSSYATTGSNNFNGNQAITGSLNVTQNITGSNALLTGTVTAQTLVIQTITSSIVYSSGSNIFGNQLTNTQQLTGSVTVTGSLGVNGFRVVDSSQTASMSVLSSSYALTASFALNGGGGGISAISIADEGVLIGTASYFDFIGNNVSASVVNNTASITIIGATGTSALTQSVAAATWSFTHNLNTYTPLLQVYDATYNQLIPNAIEGITPNVAQIRFDYSQSGYAIASNGGPLTVSGSTAQLNQTVGALTWSFTHNLNSKYVNFEVYDSNDFVVIPANIKVVDTNNANLYFATPTTGTAIAMFSGINGAPNATTASYALTASFVNPLNQKVIITGSLIQGLAGNIASGDGSHAEGYGTQALGTGSHAEGYFTVASGDYQHVQGQYNITSSAQSAFIIGNGASTGTRSNLVFASGSQFQITGSLNVSGSVTTTTGYVVLTQVSASLNFVDDTAAAAGGVPLGGLYRNGNFISIRIA